MNRDLIRVKSSSRSKYKQLECRPDTNVYPFSEPIYIETFSFQYVDASTKYHLGNNTFLEVIKLLGDSQTTFEEHKQIEHDFENQTNAV